MNKKQFLALIIFSLCIIILFINFLVDFNISTTDEFNKLFFLNGILAYVIIYFIYVVIIRYYSEWKKFFYDYYIKRIKNTLRRSPRRRDDGLNILGLSLLVNFFSVYFILITTPNQILSRIPGFEGITIFPETPNNDVYEIVNQFTRIDYALPFSIIGVVLIFILRFVRLKRIDNEEKHTGATPLLAFMYAVLGIIIIQVTLLSLGNTNLVVDLDTFLNRIVISIFFSVFGVFAIFVVIFLDVFLLRNLKLK